MGGLSRKSFQIKQLQKKRENKTLILDAGALFNKKNSLTKEEREQIEIYAHTIARSKIAMGYSAFGIATQDLSLGIEFLQNIQKEFDFPWISMNLVSPIDNKPLFPTSILKQINGVKIGILGLTGNEFQDSDLMITDYKIIPWMTILPEYIKEIKSQADLIILLSSYSSAINKKIAEQHKDIHIIIQSGHSKNNMDPQLINNTLLFQTGSLGKYLGAMEIDWNNFFEWGVSHDVQLKKLNSDMDRLNWQISKLAKRLSPEELAINDTHIELTRKVNTLTSEIIALGNDTSSETQKPGTFKNRFISLKMALKEDKPIKSFVDSAKRKANNLNRKQFLIQKKTTDNQQHYQLTGPQTCKKCHSSQYSFWEKNGHADAWKTLVLNNQQFNRNCIVCHVTIPSRQKPTEQFNQFFTTMTSEFKTVGCEECHGPGKNHSTEPGKNHLLAPVEKTCRNCHNADHDNNFDFNRKIAMIQCPAT